SIFAYRHGRTSSIARNRETTKPRKRNQQRLISWFRVFVISWFGGLRVSDAHMFRMKEPRQQHVDAEQALARKRHAVLARLLQIAFSRQRRELLAEALEDVDAVLVAKVRRTQAPELELQHELANHSLVGGRPIRAIERNLATADGVAVGLP